MGKCVLVGDQIGDSSVSGLARFGWGERGGGRVSGTELGVGQGVCVFGSRCGGGTRTGICQLTSEAGTCSFEAASSSLRTRADAVLEVLAMSLLGAGAAEVVLRDLTSLAISRGAVTLVIVAAGTMCWLAG